MDKDEVRAKVEMLKAQGKGIAVNLTEEEWNMVYTIPRPTPERLAIYHAKAAETRRKRKEAYDKLYKDMQRDVEIQIDELVPVALLTLSEAMAPNQKIETRFKAAVEVLNRRFGRPSQAVEVTRKEAEAIVYDSTVLKAMKEGEAATRN